VGVGTGVSVADNGGTSIAMTPYQKMELASVTKNITAVATMKLLRRNHLTIESYVWPYLPKTWDVSKFKAVRFRHLLTHTSGLNQAITAMANPPTNNGWDAMQTIVANGTVVDSDRQYKNANFALLRILNAQLWLQTSGYEGTQITKDNHSDFALDYDRKFIFEPAGLYGVGCITSSSQGLVRSYPQNATQTSTGAVLGSSKEECAGARGIALSAVQLVQYLAYLRHGSIIDPADLATMDELRAGWSENANGYDGNGDGKPDNDLSPGVFWHGGDLLGTNELHTCAMTFADGTEATLLVNSKLDDDANSPCGVLIRAWHNAF